VANLLSSTSFRVGDSASVTIPSTQSGSTLVVVSWGGAIVVAKLGGSGGTSFTKRAASLDDLEVTCQDISTSGGDTVVYMALAGTRNVDGVIYEIADLGSFLTGAAPNTTSWDIYNNVSPGSLTVAAPAVIFSAFARLDTNAAATRKFWGIEPLGTEVLIPITEWMIPYQRISSGGWQESLMLKQELGV